MGIRELRDAFNEVTGLQASCSKALMDYKISGNIQYQVLFFSGNFADGTGFVISSELIRPLGDLAAASRETATKLLQQRTPAT